MSSMSSLGANNVTFMVQSKHNANAASMDVSSMMAGSGVTMKAKDMVTDDMLCALQKHYKSEINPSEFLKLPVPGRPGRAPESDRRTAV